MPKAALLDLEPRKTPQQSRSVATVEAIYDATIQVLLKKGADRLTTVHVAHRAGVSVGTLYQYFPNKQALLFAVLERHMQRVVEAVEEACVTNHFQPLEVMVDADACWRPSSICKKVQRCRMAKNSGQWLSVSIAERPGCQDGPAKLDQ